MGATSTDHSQMSPCLFPPMHCLTQKKTNLNLSHFILIYCQTKAGLVLRSLNQQSWLWEGDHSSLGLLASAIHQHSKGHPLALFQNWLWILSGGGGGSFVKELTCLLHSNEIKSSLLSLSLQGPELWRTRRGLLQDDCWGELATVTDLCHTDRCHVREVDKGVGGLTVQMTDGLEEGDQRK